VVTVVVRDAFWLMSMQVGLKAAYDCVKVFSETDLTEDLKGFDVPTLIIHGDAIRSSRSPTLRSSLRRSSRAQS
jgi:pimeloyl-ACP methyl ester carboxylesterase